MTVNAGIVRVSYAGDGATLEFAYPHRFYETGDLTVWLVDEDGEATLQEIATHYTVSGEDTDSDGMVTMLTEPAVGETLIIINDPDIEQTYEYETADAFPAASHERALDRLTIICQRLSDRLDRCLHVPDYSDEDLPDTDEILAVAESVATVEAAAAAAEAAAAEAVAAAAEAVAIVIGTINATQIVFTPIAGIVAINVATAIAELQSEKQAVAEKGAADGYASLDSGTKVPIAQLPTASAAEIRALAADKLIDTDGITAAAAYVAGGNVTGNLTPDFTQFINITYTQTGNVTLKFPSVAPTNVIGRSGFIEFVQDATGGRTLDVENAVGYKYSEGTEISIDTTASRKNGVAYHIRSATEIWLSLPYKGCR
jgi:hypothetical protein